MNKPIISILGIPTDKHSSHLSGAAKAPPLIFKEFHADFYQRATGDVEFSCDMGAQIKDMIEESILTANRVNLPITVNATVPSISDVVIAKFILTLSVKVK